MSREDLVNIADKLMKLRNKNAPRPGRSWLEGFLKRHPLIALRATQSVSKASGNVSENNLRSWHNTITSSLTQYDKLHIVMNCPELVFNSDESCFPVVPASNKVFAHRGVKNVFKIAHGKEKVSVTAMYCISAAGQLIPPMMIFKNNYKMLEIAHKMPGKIVKI